MAEPLVGQGLSNTGTGGGLPQGQSPNPAQDVGGGRPSRGGAVECVPSVNTSPSPDWYWRKRSRRAGRATRGFMSAQRHAPVRLFDRLPVGVGAHFLDRDPRRLARLPDLQVALGVLRRGCRLHPRADVVSSS
jgi:hypothetical protein